jgi:hypothetical protein
MSNEVQEVATLRGVLPEEPLVEPQEDEHEEAPTGTLFFMMLFLLLMVGLWATVYWMLLSR